MATRNADAPQPPPSLFDLPTILSLLSTVVLVAAAWALSRRVLPRSPPTAPALRFLFVWHAADALCHFLLEGGYLYHCFLSSVPRAPGRSLVPAPYNFLGRGGEDRVWGPQAGGTGWLAQLWMVYARADRRWAGADLGVISLELLTVFVGGPLACYICYLIARRDPRASIWMIILATCELYGGFMTFCPEWLTGNLNLDTSNFMYLWVYLIFFNMLWVFIPMFAIWYSFQHLSGILRTGGEDMALRKGK